MRLSKYFWQTYKEIPADAEIASHKLLLRTGMIHKIGAGLYSYLPMGLRVIRKIENIIREELEKIDASELSMNFVTPAELWKESGRWEKMGSEMQRFKDQRDNDFCLSPTNEETITDIFKKTTNSYKQLPVNLFQVTTKYRNEIRPRFGLMRGKEFSMKDAYTFSLNKECLDSQYEKYYQAYSNIFKRMNLDFIIVEADGGNIATGDAKTHEFQVIANSGEDLVVHAKSIGFAANIEKAETLRNLDADSFSTDVEVKEVETKDLPTCEAVAKLLNIPLTQTLKSLVFTSYWGEKTAHYMIMLLGDDDLNEIKLKNFLKADKIEVAKEKVLKELGLVQGYMSPIGVDSKLSVLFDKSINLENSYVVGANKKDFHTRGFTPKRDCENAKIADLRMAKAGDLAPDNKTKVDFTRGIEVGHIFQLGDKYSKAMKALVLDQNGKKVAPLMGCYGIGITRTLAAAIEQSHDEDGIVWPYPLAPYQIYFAAMAKSDEYKVICDEVYSELISAGYEVLYDDRGQGMGAMMKDADLLGLPIRIFLGERDFKDSSELEIKIRKSGEKSKVTRDKLIPTLDKITKELK